MTPQEAAQKFIDDTLANIPEERRATVLATIDANPELLEAIGGGVLRQADYSRAMDAINTRAQQQTEWYDANKPILELGTKAKAAGFDPAKAGGTPPPAGDVVSREDFARAEQEYAGFVLETNFLQAKHLHEFNEPLDLPALAKDPRIKTLGLRGVYEAVVAPRRAERATAATEAEITRRVNEGLAAARRGGENPNFPGSKLEEGSPLDALAPVNPSGASVDELTDMYHQLVAANAR